MPSEVDEDDLYEQYLDATLEGVTEPPEIFCARHGVASGALRERLLALHRLIERRDVAPAAGSTSSRPAPARPPLVAEAGLPWPRLGEFRLLRRIGEGGMGVVYLAEQESLGRLVALKVIRPELAASASASERFRREAKAVARLRHPSVVRVHAFGEEHGVLWCALELVPGRSLATILEEARATGTPPPIPRVLRWLESIARALAAAHAEGILHRDVKPSNVRVTTDDRALLVDFGIARDLASSAPTITRQFTGSPAYASPEQVASRGGELDGRTDVYSLGVTLYECLTLAIPFADDSLERVFQRILQVEPVPVRRLRAAVPRDLATVVQKAIEKDPQRRYASAADFAADLLAVLELRPIRARPPGPIALARRWVRTHGRLATAAGALLLALALFATFRIIEERRLGEQRARAAAARVASAEQLLARYVARRSELADVAKELARVEQDVPTNYVPPARAALLDRKGDVERQERERAVIAQEIEQQLLEAERLGAPTAAVERVRADLWVEQLREAREQRDRPAIALASELARRHDREGRHAAEIALDVRITIVTDPPGAAVHLFRMQRHSDVVAGGQDRWVPAPLGAAPPIAPGTTVLRVAQPAGDLRHNDLIVTLAGQRIGGSLFVLRDGGPVARFDRLVRVDDAPVVEPFDLDGLRVGSLHRFEFARADGSSQVVEGESLAQLGLEVGDAAAAAERGGALARVITDTGTREVVLPPGLLVRTTAAPLLLSPGSLVGITPFESSVPSWDVHVALLRRAGFEDARIVIHPAEGQNTRARVQLLPERTSPPGMIRIAAPFPPLSPFWIADREVTADEYLEFLNDPATQQRIGRALPTPLVPRAGAGSPPEGSWPRDEDGRFRLRPGVDPRWPVLGISWHDAKEYVAWMNRRTGIEARGLRYALPTLEEWRSAAHSRPSLYVYGENFRPHWFKSCYSRPKPDPEPVLRFPIDESDTGVFDLTGSASEWCDAPFDDPSKGQKAVAGGSWADGDPITFRAEAAFGMPPGVTTGTIGLRLACRPIEASK